MDCLFVCLSDVWGGVEKNVLVRLQELSARGYKVAVVVLENMFERRFTEKNIQVFTVPRGGRLRLIERRNVSKLIKRLRPRSVFAAIKADWWLVAWPAHRYGVQSIVLYLGIKRKMKENTKYRLLFQTFGAKLLVNSLSLKEYALSTSGYLNDSNVKVIYNGFVVRPINDESNEKISLGQLPSLPDGTFVIGCAGRFARAKQYHLLAEILPNLPEHVHVLLAGEGAEEESIRQALANSGVSHRVHFLGQLSYEQMPEFYRHIDMFLHLSRLEGMANVLSEALSFSKPVVTARASGTDEATDFGHFGIVKEPDDVEGLTEGIKQVISGAFPFDPGEARDWIKERFSRSRMMDDTEQLLFGKARALKNSINSLVERKN